MMKEDVALVLFKLGFAKASLKIWVYKIKVHSLDPPQILNLSSGDQKK